MEPVTIAFIATAVFGAVMALSVFIRQLLLSRDKNLNDKAQKRALAQEAKELKRLRQEMENNKRFDSHYQVLGSNKDAIQYLDQKIEEILNKKLLLIQRYAEMTLKESAEIIDEGHITHRKAICDLLREEIDNEIAFYDDELQQLQNRRASLWDSHFDLQEYLLEQEKSRNQHLDIIYQRHTAMLEKIYLRHHKHAEAVAKKTIEAGTNSFSILTAPMQFLLKFFGLSSDISLRQATDEQTLKNAVSDAEKDINGDGYNHSEETLQESSSKDNLFADFRV